MNVNELSNRLERLERENRMMKRAAFALVAVTLAERGLSATQKGEAICFLAGRRPTKSNTS